MRLFCIIAVACLFCSSSFVQPACVQVKEGKEPGLFTAYFQAWDTTRKQRTAADYEARVAALNDESAKAADTEKSCAACPISINASVGASVQACAMFQEATTWRDQHLLMTMPV